MYEYPENTVSRVTTRLGLLLLVVFSMSAPLEAARRAEWRKPEYPRRAVFSIPKDAGLYLLVDVPMDNKPADGQSFECISAEGKKRPCFLVHSDNEKASILVCIGPEASEDHELYYGAEGALGHKQIADPVPVSVSIYKSSAKGIPNAWDKMLYMAGRSKTASKTLRQHYFGKIDGLPDNHWDQSSSWKYPIIKLQSHILCTQSGPYRFGINCRDAGFILLDGEVAASWPGEHPAGSWKSGPPVYLDVGIHELTVYTKAKYVPHANVGWQPPGVEKMRSIPHSALICAARSEEPRCEIRDEQFHPDFVFSTGTAYAVRNHRSVFTPVRFRNKSVFVEGGKWTYSWDFGDGQKADGPSVDHIFSEARKYEVSLTVTNKNGAKHACARTVDCRMVQPYHYAVSAEVTGLPAVCYPEDNVDLALQVQWAPAYSSLSRKMPKDIMMQLSWSIESNDGSESGGSQELPMMTEPFRTDIVNTNAGAISRISWDISHHGIRVVSREVSFVGPPFDNSVASIDAEKLFNSGGERLVLVPVMKKDKIRQEAIKARQAYGRIVCLDDTLLPAGVHTEGSDKAFHTILSELMDGEDGPSVQHVQLADWDDSSKAYAPLMRILEAVRAVEGADLVVLSVGLQDIFHEIAPQEFERHAAALSDLIWGTMKCPVVWVTPPPYTATSTEVRPFAAAVQRVAQVRDMPVADLYSAFMSTGDEMGILFKGNDEFALSVRGHRLAARAIMRVLLRQGGEN